MPVSPSGVVQEAVSGSLGTFTAQNSAVTLLQANPRRKGMTIYSLDGAANSWWYVRLGPGASQANWTFILEPGDYFEMPFGYTGVITAASVSTTGSIQVTELV